MSKTSLIVVLILVIVIIAWLIKTYNNFITLRERVANAKGQIAAQVESRWDAIKNLIDATKKYTKYEAETLENIITQRVTISNNSPIDQIEGSDQQLDHVLGRLLATSENYP